MNQKLKQFIKEEEGWSAFKDEIIKRLEERVLAIKVGMTMEEAFGDYRQKCGLLEIETFIRELENEVYVE